MEIAPKHESSPNPNPNPKLDWRPFNGDSSKLRKKNKIRCIFESMALRSACACS